MVKDFFNSYAGVPWGVIVPPIIFGFLWGLGSMTLGLSFSFIGLSLAYAMNYGAQIAFGAFAPMLLRRPEQILMPHGLVVLAGVAVCLLGVVISGRAGVLKSRRLEDDKLQQANSEKSGWKSKILFGLVLAFVSGLLCACYAVAVDFGNDLQANPFVVMSLILWSGSVSSCSYCVFQLCKNKTWGSFCQAGPRTHTVSGGHDGVLARRGHTLFWQSRRLLWGGKSEFRLAMRSSCHLRLLSAMSTGLLPENGKARAALAFAGLWPESVC